MDQQIIQLNHKEHLVQILAVHTSLVVEEESVQDTLMVLLLQ